MKQTLKNISQVQGELSLPGDKSISHRAIIFSALADGESTIKNLADSQDVNTTIECLIKLGVKIENVDDVIRIEGAGFNGFSKPGSPLYCGNSGTTTRLLSGVLATQNFPAILTGDDSLSKRPMKRIIEPLEKMGCKINSNNGKLPLHFFPSDKIIAIDYILPVASAQVKGAVLMAGLHSADTTSVEENNMLTRDHTERMLNLPIEISGRKKITKVSSVYYPIPADCFIPGDISTAAFFIVLTLLSKNSELLLKNVSLNKTRIQFLDLLIKMRANIKIEEKAVSNNEPFGDILVKSSDLKNVKIDTQIIPNIIDEIPILSVAGAFADGEIFIENAMELRVKESDRIKSICFNLKKAGFEVSEFEDGFSISGKMKDNFNSYESFGDHRIAMAFAVFSSLNEAGGEIVDFESVSVSNPKFLDQLAKITIQ